MADILQEDNYTVAWIAVLPIEAEAALGVLDKKHEGEFESSYGHDYIYIGGEINGHNVVITTLQAGQNYGVGSAAALASQLKVRFRNIWLALLVGIAAGIPNLTPIDPTKRRDVRLGDVLVCIPGKTETGIVQYDLGTETKEGFTLTGRQAETLPIIRGAIAKIQLTKKRPYKKGNDFARYLEALQVQDEDGIFECPSQDKDQYFPHSADKDSPIAPAERTLRDKDERTRVWYGSIGSGNSVIRSAQRRDELRDRYDLIGLEMEAAGVMNVIPAGVIRGVCDYADEHKAKDWQPYAAAVAAVYAKGILSVIRPKKDHGPVLKRQMVCCSHQSPFPPQSFRIADKAHMQGVPSFATLLTPDINMAPLQNPDFVGREDVLKEIESALKTRQKVALVGLGGIGKSEIAAAYCYLHLRASASTAIFWVHGDTTSAFVASYQRIAEALRLKTERSSDLVTMQLVVESLKQNHHGKWLMVIDNADDYRVFTELPQTAIRVGANPDQQQLLKPLRHYIPNSPNGRVLITSRVRNVAQSLAGYQISVPNLTPTESQGLMKIKLHQKAPDDETIQQLVTQLEHLPLAITQACACIMIQMPAKKYLSFLQKGEQHQIKLLRKSVIDIRRREGRPEEQSPNDSVIQTWTTSLAQMNTMGSSKAIDVVCFISHFYRHGVPESLIIEAFGEEEAEDQLGLLNDFGLITRRSDPESVDMHRFTQLTAWAWLEQESRLSESQALALTTINKALETSHNESDTSMGKLLAPHAEEIRKRQFSPSQQLQLGIVNFWLGWHLMERSQQARAAEVFAIASEIFEKENCDDAGMVINATAGHVNMLVDLGRHKEAEKIVLATMDEINEELHKVKTMSKDHLVKTWLLLEAWCKVLIGRVLWGKGEWSKAEVFLREALQVRRTYLEADHESIIPNLSLLGIVLRHQCKYVQSLEITEEALHQSVKLYGDDHERVYECYNELGLCLLSLQRYDEAENALRKALTGRAALLPEHIYTLQSRHSLTVFLHKAAKINDLQALEDIESQLTTARELLKDEHPTTMLINVSRAVMLKDCGRIDEAHVEFIKMLEQREKLLGPDHPDTVSALIEVAISHRALNHHDQVSRLAGIAYQKSKSIMGDHHGRTVLAGCFLALETAKHDPSQGELIALTILKGCEDTLDPNDERIRDAAWAVVAMYKQTDQLQLAIPYLENICDRDKSGPTLRALQSQFELAKLLSKAEKYSAADSHYSEVIQSYISHQGAEDSTLYSYVYDRALSLYHARQYGEAESILRDLIDKQNVLSGELDRRILESKSLLALILQAREGYEAAEILNKEVLDKRRKLLGANDPQVYQSLNNLALVLCDRKQFDEAIKIINESYAGYRKVVGADHGDTLLAMHNIAAIHKFAGDLPKASIACSEAREARERALGLQHRQTLETLRLQLEILQGLKDSSGFLETRNDAVERHVQKFGSNHRLTFTVLQITGRALLELGDVRKAEADLRRVFDGCLENLREDLIHKRPVKYSWKMAYFGLAQIYQNEARLQDLSRLIHDTMDIERLANGPGSSEMAHLHVRLGYVLQGMKMYTEAVDQYEAHMNIEETLNIFDTDRYIYSVRFFTNALVEEGNMRPQSEALLLTWRAAILAIENQTAIEALIDIARCFHHLQNQHAEETFEQILHLVIKLSGAGSRKEWDVRSELAHHYFASGRYQKAAALFERVAKAFTDSDGIDNITSVQKTSDLIMSNLYSGRLSDVEDKMRWVLSTRQGIEGEASPGCIVTQSLLGMILRIKDNLPESINYCRAVLGFRLDRDGNSPTPDVARAQYWLGWTLMENKELEDAEQFAKAAYEGRVSIPTMGSSHRDTLLAMALWARIRHLRATTIQALHEAEIDLAGVVEKQLIRQGENHPFTLLSMQYLAWAQAAQSDYVAALETVQRAVDGFRTSDNMTHPFMPSTLELLARLYAVTGKTEQAEAAYLETVHCSRQIFGGINRHSQLMSAVGGAVLFLVRRWMATQHTRAIRSYSDSDHSQRRRSLVLVSASSSWEVGDDVW